MIGKYHLGKSWDSSSAFDHWVTFPHGHTKSFYNNKIIENKETYEYEGNLYQLTVRRDEANYFVYAWARLNNQIDLYPREVILPDGVTPQELSLIHI